MADVYNFNVTPNPDGFVPLSVEQDGQERKVLKDKEAKGVYLGLLTFNDSNWTRETAIATMAAYAAVAKKIPADGVLYPIIDTKGLSVPFNIPLSNLAGIQKLLGPQIIVNASFMVKGFGGIYKRLGGDLHFVDTIEEAIALREELITKRSAVEEA